MSRFYPRDAVSRRDALARGSFPYSPREPQSKADMLALDVKGVYDSPGLLRTESYATVYEGVLASTGWTQGLVITNEAENWNATEARVQSEVAVGISSFGLTVLVDSITRDTDKHVTVGIGPDATFVASAHSTITLTVPRSGFTNRTLDSEAVNFIRVEPFSMSYTGPSSIAEGLIAGTTGIIGAAVFTLNNTMETFSSVLSPVVVASLFTGIPVGQSSVFFNAARTSLTVTLIGSTGYSIGADTHFRPVFPADDSFTLRKAAFTTATLCVVHNEA